VKYREVLILRLDSDAIQEKSKTQHDAVISWAVHCAAVGIALGERNGTVRHDIPEGLQYGTWELV
jgi:hypothetical protein